MLEKSEKCKSVSAADKANEKHLISTIHIFSRVYGFDKLQPTDREYRKYDFRRKIIRSWDFFTFVANPISIVQHISRWLRNQVFREKRQQTKFVS
jgi:hypothetical protein